MTDKDIKNCISKPDSSNCCEKNTSRPDVYRYQNYREFLKDWFNWKKKTQASYSGAMFARKVGLSSHTFLGMVIRGDRNLSYNTLVSFTKALDLKGGERTYFEKLVLFEQAKNSEDRKNYFDDLTSLSMKKGNSVLTDLKNYVKYISCWYNVAIRELVYLKDFNPDPEWISQKLKKKISKKEAQLSWELLLDLKLVKQNNSTGKYEVSDPAIDIDPGGVNFAIRNYHKAYLNLVNDAIDKEPIDDRQLSSLTLALSDREFVELKEKINDFRKSINLLYSSSNNEVKDEKRKVATINMQLLVLTNNEKGGSNGEIKD